MAVLRPRARFRVVLDRTDRFADDLEAFVRIVEEREVRRLDLGRQALRVDDKTVVLAGDLDFAGEQILDRVIGAAMAAGHLAGRPAKRQRQ